jgi:replicative DNA helicase
MTTERHFPHSIEAECGVLGSIIIDPEAVVQVADFLTSDDFYRDANRTLYGVIIQLYDQRTPADFITVCDVLEQHGKLEDIGGASYISSLINNVPTSGNAVYYGRIVSRTALLRRLITAGGQIVAQAYEDSEVDAALTLERAEQLIFEISERYSSSTATASHVRELLAAYMNRLDQVHEHRGAVLGVSTGFEGLDRLLSGLQRSDLIILAARPSLGKTALALNMAYNAAVRLHRSVGIFSLEMSKEQLIQRLLAIGSGVDQQRLRTGWIEDNEWERIISVMGTLSEADIWIDDTSTISTIQLRSKARRWVLEHDLDLIIVDYLQLMQAPSNDGRKQENRVQEVSAISRALKGLARELNIPVLALAQLSRAVENRVLKVPQLSDLRESGGLEADADVVLFIYRDDVYNPASQRPNTADIIIAKHRNGPVGEVCLAFDKSQTRFRDMPVGSTREEQPARAAQWQEDDEITLEDEDNEL